MNRELNSQIGIRSQDSHFSESDGAPATSMVLWGAGYYVRYVKCDANDSVFSKHGRAKLAMHEVQHLVALDDRIV